MQAEINCRLFFIIFFFFHYFMYCCTMLPSAVLLGSVLKLVPELVLVQIWVLRAEQTSIIWEGQLPLISLFDPYLL